MTIKVIGAGYGRTGTLSLTLALEILGFKKCHHMRDLQNDLKQTLLWRRISKGQKPSWQKVFKGYDACVDWPSSLFWRELASEYPESKIILTTRDVNDWYSSVMHSIYPKTKVAKFSRLLTSPKVELSYKICRQLIWQGLFAGNIEDEKYAKSKFENHILGVLNSSFRERILIFDIRQGWDPLCSFLNKPVPSLNFPFVNTSRE